MIAAIGGVAFLALALGGQACRSGAEISTAVVPDGSSSVLTIANFVRIKRFILAQGKRKTYSNMYNDNPYWAFPKFTAYLNPPDQRNIDSDIAESEFNELVIQAAAPQPANQHWSNPGPITQYSLISLDAAKKELRVRRDCSRTDPRVLVQEAAEYFRVALAEIDKLTGNGEPGRQDAVPGR